MAAAGDLQRRQGETVLITGASSGIGRELARLFAGYGAELVLVARSEGRLRELAGELAAGYGARAQIVPADLSQSGGPGQIMEALAQQHIDVDVLVNNAGFGAHGPVAGIGVARQLEMIEVNVAWALPGVSDAHGVDGWAIIHAARLLDAPALRRHLAITGANLGFITSPFVYDTIIQPNPGHADPALYRQVKCRVKKEALNAWMYLAQTSGEIHPPAAKAGQIG